MAHRHLISASQDDVSAYLQTIVKSAVENFSIATFASSFTPLSAEAPNADPWQRPTKRTKLLDESTINHEDGAKIADLYSACVQLRLVPEADELIIKLRTQLPASPFTFDINEFYHLTLPLLLQLLPIFKEHRISLTKPEIQSLYLNCYTTLSCKYVIGPPLRPSTWSRPSHNCGCRICKPIESFLIDSHCRQGMFKVPKCQQWHVQYLLRNQDVEHKTLGLKGGYQMEIRKNERSYQIALAAWRERVQNVKATLKCFEEEDLRTLLGSMYDQIDGAPPQIGIGFQNLGGQEATTNIPVPDAPGNALRETSTNIPRANAVPGKRKAGDLDVVDLTGVR